MGKKKTIKKIVKEIQKRIVHLTGTFHSFGGELNIKSVYAILDSYEEEVMRPRLDSFDKLLKKAGLIDDGDIDKDWGMEDAKLLHHTIITYLPYKRKAEMRKREIEDLRSELDSLKERHEKFLDTTVKKIEYVKPFCPGLSKEQEAYQALEKIYDSLILGLGAGSFCSSLSLKDKKAFLIGLLSKSTLTRVASALGITYLTEGTELEDYVIEEIGRLREPVKEPIKDIPIYGAGLIDLDFKYDPNRGIYTYNGYPLWLEYYNGKIFVNGCGYPNIKTMQDIKTLINLLQ